MIARIRLQRGCRIQRKSEDNRNLALAVGALLIPGALMAYVLGLWRLASDMGIAGEFGISGVFSHWQIWIGMGGLMQASSSVLNRYGRSGDLQLPRLLMFRISPRRPPDHPDAPAPERKVG